MTDREKTIIQGLRSVAGGTDEHISIDVNRPLFVSPHDRNKTFNFSNYAGEIDAILDQLQADGHIARHGSNYISLTYKGLHPFRTGFENIKQVFIFSILIPAIVALITAYITARVGAQ